MSRTDAPLAPPAEGFALAGHDWLGELRSPHLWAVAATLGAITMMWTTYNEYLPQILTGFFGLPALVTTLVLTLDNLLGFVLEPVVGVVSDRTRTRLGKRLPWILVGTPLAVAAFTLIPLPLLRLPVALDGTQAAARQALNPLALAVVGTMLAMSLFRTPTVALMPDLVASAGRPLASALLQMVSGVGTLGALWSGDWLLDTFGPAAPFWVASAIMLVTALVLWWLTRGRQEEAAAPPAPLVPYPAENRRDILLLLAAIAGWWAGFLLLDAFFGQAATSRARLSEQQAELLLQLWLLSMTFTALPVGLLSGRMGRRRMVSGGTLLMIAVVALWTLAPQPLLPTALLLGAGGVGWGMVLVHSLPMLLDLGPQSRGGTSTGLYYLAFASAGLVTPWLVRAVRPDLGSAGLWLAPLAWGLALLAVASLRPGAGEQGSG